MLFCHRCIVYQVFSKCAKDVVQMCYNWLRNLLQMCSKCVPNVFQVCALQFAMKVIWCADQRPTICRIGQFHMIVMRIRTMGIMIMMMNH